MNHNSPLIQPFLPTFKCTVNVGEMHEEGEKFFFYVMLGDCGENKGIAYLPLLISQGDEGKIRFFTKSTSKVTTPLASPVNAYSLAPRLVRRASSGLD